MCLQKAFFFKYFFYFQLCFIECTDYLQNFRFVPQSNFDGITVGFNWFLSTACLNQSTYFVRETEECEGFLIIDTGERHIVTKVLQWEIKENLTMLEL